MRWDCDKNGCFNKLCRPKIEAFADCFPGRINFGDVDGIVEVSGNILMLEWKRKPGIPTGQRRMYEAITMRDGFNVVCGVGNAETMQVDSFTYFHNGKESMPVAASLNDLKSYMRRWALWAQKCSYPPR